MEMKTTTVVIFWCLRLGSGIHYWIGPSKHWSDPLRPLTYVGRVHYYWSVHPWSDSGFYSRERNPWSFNATTRYWVNSSKFWKPIICRFVLWVLILFHHQWLLDAKISGGVSLLYNRILLVRASVIWRLQVLGPSSKMGLIPPCSSSFPCHAHLLPSLFMALIAHRSSPSPSLSSSSSSSSSLIVNFLHHYS